MDSSNYGIPANYDQNDTNGIDGTRKQKQDLKGVEAIITEGIIKNNILEINLYKQEYGNDEYIKSNTYEFPLIDYEEIMLKDILDMSRFFPTKHLHIEPMPDYLLGYTAIGSQNIFRNARLIPGSERAYEVDVHETIHTNDEFETRVLTSWILDKDINKYMFNRGVVFKK
jgi:hypothetical protein